MTRMLLTAVFGLAFLGCAEDHKDHSDPSPFMGDYEGEWNFAGNPRAGAIAATITASGDISGDLSSDATHTLAAFVGHVDVGGQFVGRGADGSYPFSGVMTLNDVGIVGYWIQDVGADTYWIEFNARRQ